MPKTLIFAKDDSHADDIVQIVREEFGKGNDFCQKITYRTTRQKPEELIAGVPELATSAHRRDRRHDRHRHRHQAARVLVFMRDVKSRDHFEQMKGRGVRVISTPTSRLSPPTRGQGPVRGRRRRRGDRPTASRPIQPLERKPTVALKALLTARRLRAAPIPTSSRRLPAALPASTNA